MKKIFIKPKSGLKVIDPKSRLALPESGKEVLRSKYWIRRIKDGDVVVEQKTKPAQKTKLKKKEVIEEKPEITIEGVE